tara:strand:- start:21125 stop:21709 length:585 start_codon:yes stop_codon:yes gene_type:complete
MKNIFKKVKIYFTRLFAALRGKETEKVVVEKVYGQKRRELSDFELERIKKIMDMTEFILPDENSIQEGFIKNRVEYNKYKEWYWKLVGFKTPPEDLKKLIDADLKMDRIEMDNLYVDLLDKSTPKSLLKEDNKINISNSFNNALKNGKDITPEFEDELLKSIDKASTKLKKGNTLPKDLNKLLEQNKENLKRIK